MATSLYESGADPFTVLGQDTSLQRKQIGQYAIAQAASKMQSGQSDQAIAALKKAVAIDPQSAIAFDYLGKLYLSQGKNAEAIKAYKQLVRIQSSSNLADISTNAPTQVEAHVSLGNAYLQDKQYNLSEKEFKTATTLGPRNPLPPYTLGLQYSNTNRLPEAEAMLLKAKKIAPNDGNVYYALGMVYNKQGRSEEAAANLEKALTLKKKFPAANYELGVAYDALGRTEDAQRQLSILKNSDYKQYNNLKALLDHPGISYINATKKGDLLVGLGRETRLYDLDPSLQQPNGTKTFSVTIGFSTEMDRSSVINVNNWDISRAAGGKGAYYDYATPLYKTSDEVALPAKPEAVYYNSTTREATLIFRLNQTSTVTAYADQSVGDAGATIDPQHIVFKFSGKDSLGRTIDKTADQVNGFSGKGY
jgi:tetratricopeptide (TPR) repeat protein